MGKHDVHFVGHTTQVLAVLEPLLETAEFRKLLTATTDSTYSIDWEIEASLKRLLKVQNEAKGLIQHFSNY